MTRMLTKNERHMLGVALDVLRHNVLAEPGRRGGKAGPALYETLLRLDTAENYGRRIEARAAWAIMLADALRLAAWPYPLRRPKHQRRAERILRARLALAIRAVLRADRGERGWSVCEHCGTLGRPGYECRYCAIDAVMGDGERSVFPQFRPLWTTAPGHEAGR